jgi:alanine dehydrogenase
MVHDVLHYCVTNMPGAVGRTSTFALCNVTLPWVLEIAQRGVEAAAHDLKPVARAINTYAGEVTNRAVAETFGLPFKNRFKAE